MISLLLDHLFCKFIAIYKKKKVSKWQNNDFCEKF